MGITPRLNGSYDSAVRLYHYCCHHSVNGIITSGFIRPHPGGRQTKVSEIAGFSVMALPVIWLSDLDVTTEEDTELLGLGHNTDLITCNRVEYRFRVSSASGVWWPLWAAQAESEGRITAKYRAALEVERDPQRWWVSESRIMSPRLDERYRSP